VTDASRGVRAGWVDGLSGGVDCVAVALADGVAELVGAGDVCALVVQAGGAVEDLGHTGPAVGESSDHGYEGNPVVLGNRDRIILLSARVADLTGLVTAVISDGYTSSSRDALNKLFARLGEADPDRMGLDLTGAVITRTKRIG
jgi:hypothetical protein